MTGADARDNLMTFIRKLIDRLPYISHLRKMSREQDEYLPGQHYSPVRTCPRCGGLMTSQGIQSIGAGAARLYNVEVYLCPKCGCIGRNDERAQTIVEIK